MVRVPDWSEQEFETRSNALARLVRKAWRAVARLVAGRLENQVVATSADAASLPSAWDVEVEAQILGFISDTYMDAAGKVRQTLDAPDDFLLTDDLVTAYLRTARNRLHNIGDDVWEVVSAQLIEGVSTGETIPQLAARVRNTAGVSEARSLTIARTEVHAAHEAGSYDQALFVDPEASKIWLATEDERTRPTHRAAEGQRRRLNEPFEVGGAQLRYPGDPLGPADEVINCRCTTVYDFGTLDSVTSDEPELALVAATKKKWTPSKHPRDANGRFIKKGAVQTLLSKPKPELLTVADAVQELDKKQWDKLTESQQDYLLDSVTKLPKGSALEKQATTKLAEIGVTEAPEPAAPATPDTPDVPKAKVLAQAAPATNKAAKTILEADDFAQLGKQKYKKPLGKTGKPLRVGFLGDDGSITAHVGAKPGEPAKSSTFLIWGKYPPGTTILEGEAGKASVVWNGKKYEFREEGQTTQILGKQDAYDKLHSQDGWVVPKYEGQPVDQPGVLTELVEGYEPDDEGDTDLPSPPEPPPTPEPGPEPEPEPAAPEVPPTSELAPEPESEPEAAPDESVEPEPDTLQQLFDELVEGPDVLQQLMDGTWQPTAYDAALQKLNTQSSISNADAVQIALGMTQEEWNGLTSNQRGKIVLGTDKALDDVGIDNQDSWLAYNRVSDFQAKQTAPAPGPSPATAISTPQPESKIPVGATLLPDDGWGTLVQNADSGLYPVGFTAAQTLDGDMKVVKGHTANTWHLKDSNGDTLETFTDADLENGQATASDPFQNWMMIPPPLASVVEAPAADVTPPVAEDAPGLPFGALPLGEGVNEGWSEIADNAGKALYPSGSVVAQTNDGKVKLVKAPTWDTWMVTKSDGIAIAVLTDADVKEGLVEDYTDNKEWFVLPPEPGFGPAPPPTPIADMTPDEDEEVISGESAWDDLFSDLDPVTKPTVIAQTQSGKNRLIANPGGEFAIEWNVDGDTWVDIETFTADSLYDNGQTLNEMMSSHSSNWVKTPKLDEPEVPATSAPVVVDVIELPQSAVWQPSQGFSANNISLYVDHDHPAGTIMALRNIDGVNVRVVATGQAGNAAYKQQLVNLNTGEWADFSPSSTMSAQALWDVLVVEPWLVPQPTFQTAMTALYGPPDLPGDLDAPEAPEAPAVPSAPNVGTDTSMIPLSSKKSWKKKLSAAKVGYYSKPEKIWDQIKEIQDAHPDPMNPGHSKLTPLQVIQSLDEVYTGKLNKPYESKIVPWAATPKGQAYTNNPGTTGAQATTPNTPAATQTAPPPAPQPMAKTPGNITKVFLAVQDMELGTVIATNPGDGDNHYQMVVVEDEDKGVKVPQLQYKSPATGGSWKESVSFPTENGLVEVLSIEFNNQPWQLTTVQMPSGGVAVANAPTPAPLPVSQPVSKTMASVNAVWSKIYGMPEGTVLATNKGSYNKYQIVVKTDPTGIVYAQTQKQKNHEPGAPWIDTISSGTAEELHGLLGDTLGGNEWVLLDTPIQSVPEAPAGPPAPKPFKASVKAIYAAMPTFKNGAPVAIAEVNGEKFALIPGYGITKKGYGSTKKKLLLKKQSPSGYWHTVETPTTQVQLAAILKDPKYNWMEPEDTPAVPPPSVATPVQAPKPAAASTSDVYINTTEDVSQLWDHLNEIGDGVVLAQGSPGGVPTTLKVKIGDYGSQSVMAYNSTGSYPFATDKQELVSGLINDPTWKISASKSPLFGAGEIVHLSETSKQDLYNKFKQQPATYLDSDSSSIYAALSTIASDNSLTLLQMIRVIDEVGAKKVNKPDEHLFEKKIKDWLKTPQGAAIASGKPIPLPPTPEFKAGFGPENVAPFEQTGNLDYQPISVTQAKKTWDAVVAQSGNWTGTEQSALKSYTGGIYYSINAYHYGQLPDINDSTLKVAQNAQKGMRPSIIPMLLHRGVGYDGVGGANSHADIAKMVGQTWKSGGFFSTSVGGKAAFGGPVLIEIEAPPGTPMAYLKPISNYSTEDEMLLAAGLHYKIIKVDQQQIGYQTKTVVRMRVVPPPAEEGGQQ